jgi:beta-lysine 5,6-aminomutase beta subunit
MSKIIKPYGDTMDDGKVQLSFTLPVPAGSRAMESARRIALAWGFHEAEVMHMASMSDGFTFFVVYAASAHGIDWDTVEGDRDDSEKPMSMDEINAFIRARIGRKVMVIGACTGFDAHTVGIDAIMNMKGYNHHYGLERYEMMDTHNLGAQVPNEKLIEYAETHCADAILVSQVVTQKNSHIHNLTEFMELLEAKGERSRFICIAGGPRISNKLAAKIGFDAGFGQGTYAEDVATFIVKKMAEK